MKLRNAVKTALALVLSATIALGLIGEISPVKAHADIHNSDNFVWTAVAGTPCSYGVWADGAAGSWSLTGAPAGVTIDENSGNANSDVHIAATVPAGVYNFTVRKEGFTENITLTVNPAGGADPNPRDPGSDPTSPENPDFKFLPPTGPDGHQHSWEWAYGSTYHCPICNTFYTIYAAHDHQYEWYVTRPATETEDGEAHHICKICGDVDMIEPVGAYYLFSQNAENKINKAPVGGTVSVETTRWLSFQGYVLDALAKRPDVTLSVTFRENGYKGGDMKTVTIPAGYDAASLKDANGYCGFKYLAGVFGAN